MQLQDFAAVGAAQDGEIAGGLEGLPAEDSLAKGPGAVHIGNEQVQPQPAQAAPEGNGVDPVEIHGHLRLAAPVLGMATDDICEQPAPGTSHDLAPTSHPRLR